ncbi:AAA family ATPase [Amycolatopsis balhimycina]|uniref:AAA family ATPase n=1 Tax=Amycolatopsis balhimycina TaxID=208443 RepID=UPI0003A5DE97|nr:AAA family ATPase [Amycolatopsis balhimycina]
MGNDWPLVGREQELVFARRALADAEVCGLLLTGRAGAGKTRLAKVLLAELAAGGARTHWVRAMSSASTIPFGAFAHLLPGGADGTADRAHRLNQVAGHLTRGAEGRRLVLCVDDAHLLDDLSATLVHQLAATASAFVIVIAPHGVSVPDPVFAMWKDRVAERLDVRELTRPQTTELITATLGGRLEDEAEHRLWHLSLGNPLFLRELVQGGLDSGSLSAVDGVWRWSGALTATPRLVELIETRTDRVDADERRLLELLAFGEPLGCEPLVRLGAGRVLASTEQAGLVVSERTGRRLNVRLAHPLYAEVIRRRTSPLRQRDTYRILAQTLDLTGARRAEDKPRLVRWRLAAGLPIDPQLVRAAAETLLRKDFPQAEQLAAESVRSGGGFGAKFLLAQVRIAGGRHADADALLVELAGETVSDAQHARVSATRALNLAFGLRRADDAEAVLDTAETAVSGTADDLVTARAALRAAAGACRTALDLLGPVLDRNRRADPLRLGALVVAAGTLADSGRTEACLGVVEEGLAIAARISDASAPGARVRLEHARIVALCRAGRLEEAEDLAGAGYRDAIGDPWGPALAGAAASLGTVALACGDVRGAIRRLREALAVDGNDQPHEFRPAVASALGRATAMSGRPEDVDLPGPLGGWARAWAAAPGAKRPGGRPRRRSRGCRRGVGPARRRAAEIRHDLVRFGVDADLPPDVGGILGPLYAAHARALSAADAAGLDAVARRRSPTPARGCSPRKPRPGRPEPTAPRGNSAARQSAAAQRRRPEIPPTSCGRSAARDPNRTRSVADTRRDARSRPTLAAAAAFSAREAAGRRRGSPRAPAADPRRAPTRGACRGTAGCASPPLGPPPTTVLTSRAAQQPTRRAGREDCCGLVFPTSRRGRARSRRMQHLGRPEPQASRETPFRDKRRAHSAVTCSQNEQGSGGHGWEPVQRAGLDRWPRGTSSRTRQGPRAPRPRRRPVQRAGFHGWPGVTCSRTSRARVVTAGTSSTSRPRPVAGGDVFQNEQGSGGHGGNQFNEQASTGGHGNIFQNEQATGTTATAATSSTSRRPPSTTTSTSTTTAAGTTTTPTTTTTTSTRTSEPA